MERSGLFADVCSSRGTFKSFCQDESKDRADDGSSPRKGVLWVLHEFGSLRSYRWTGLSLAFPGLAIPGSHRNTVKKIKAALA